ncbi:MAG: DUF5804 family protein [Halobacteria archaeon]
MTRIRLAGKPDYNLRYELFSSETSKKALSTYEFLETEIENTMELETGSIGSALALLNDLGWYLRRYTRFVDLQDSSVSDEEWISRQLASEIYGREVEKDDTDRFYRVIGVEDGKLLEPLYVRDSPTDYDLHEKDFQVVTRISEEEF